MTLTKILGKVAPWLAAAAAGPAGLAGMAIKTAAEALGAESETVEGITKALAGATPEQIAAVKAADQAFQIRMTELGFANIRDLEELAVKDRADARAMLLGTKSYMPAFLTIFVVFSFVGALAALMFLPVPTPNRDLVVYMIGQLSGGFATGLAFWLGSTRESGRKNDLLLQAKGDA